MASQHVAETAIQSGKLEQLQRPNRVRIRTVSMEHAEWGLIVEHVRTCHKATPRTIDTYVLALVLNQQKKQAPT